MEKWNIGILLQRNKKINPSTPRPGARGMLRVDTERALNQDSKIAVCLRPELRPRLRRRTYQFCCSNNHFQPITPVFQPSNIPEALHYHQFPVKSTFGFLYVRLSLPEGRILFRADTERTFALPLRGFNMVQVSTIVF